MTKEIQDKYSEITSEMNLGLVYYSLANYGTAIYFYEKVLEMADKYNINNIVLSCCGNLGNVYLRLGDYEKLFGFIKEH